MSWKNLHQHSVLSLAHYSRKRIGDEDGGFFQEKANQSKTA